MMWFHESNNGQLLRNREVAYFGIGKRYQLVRNGKPVIGVSCELRYVVRDGKKVICVDGNGRRFNLAKYVLVERVS